MGNTVWTVAKLTDGSLEIELSVKKRDEERGRESKLQGEIDGEVYRQVLREGETRGGEGKRAGRVVPLFSM